MRKSFSGGNFPLYGSLRVCEVTHRWLCMCPLVHLTFHCQWSPECHAEQSVGGEERGKEERAGGAERGRDEITAIATESIFSSSYIPYLYSSKMPFDLIVDL